MQIRLGTYLGWSSALLWMGIILIWLESYILGGKGQEVIYWVTFVCGPMALSLMIQSISYSDALGSKLRSYTRNSEEPDRLMLRQPSRYFILMICFQVTSMANLRVYGNDSLQIQEGYFLVALCSTSWVLFHKLLVKMVRIEATWLKWLLESTADRRTYERLSDPRSGRS